MEIYLPIVFPTTVITLISTLAQAGFEAFAVGGCVRDSLLGKTPADWDICTSALPEQICTCFAAYPLVYTGLQHGTVTVIIDAQTFEITTYRIDGDYSDRRHPDSVSFSDSLVADLARRDFTVNAMACHPQAGLVDVYNGLEDLQAGILRCVGEPNVRFQEDALRTLRALRFAAVYGFSIEPQTAHAIRTNASLLAQVAVERTTAELKKLLVGMGAQQILNAFPQVVCNIIPQMMPHQMQQPDFLERWEFATAVIAQTAGNPLIALSEIANIAVKLDSITDFKQAFDAVMRWAMELKLDRLSGHRVAMLVAGRALEIGTEDAELKRLLNRLGAEQACLLVTARHACMLVAGDVATANQLRKAGERIEQMLRDGVCFQRKMLAVKGDDLKAIGISDGRRIGSLLDQMLQQVMDGRIENQKQLLLDQIKNKL